MIQMNLASKAAPSTAFKYIIHANALEIFFSQGGLICITHILKDIITSSFKDS